MAETDLEVLAHCSSTSNGSGSKSTLVRQACPATWVALVLEAPDGDLARLRLSPSLCHLCPQLQEPGRDASPRCFQHNGRPVNDSQRLFWEAFSPRTRHLLLAPGQAPQGDRTGQDGG